jgi:hypothetical protein
MVRSLGKPGPVVVSDSADEPCDQFPEALSPGAAEHVLVDGDGAEVVEDQEDFRLVEVGVLLHGLSETVDGFLDLAGALGTGEILLD